MATSTTLEIILQARDEASATLKSISAQAAQMGKTAGIMGGAIVGALGLAVKAASDAQVSMASVHATLASMGKDTPEVSNAIQKAADATLALGFDNEAAALSLTKFYQRTKDITTATKLNNVAMDLARAKHIDLESAATLVNQVLSGNGKVLKQYGIDIKETSSPLEALSQLHGQVAGQADAYAKTFSGSMEVFKQQSGELMETIGAQLLPILTKLLQQIAPMVQKVLDWTQAHPELTKNIVLVVGALGLLLTVMGAIGIAIGPITAAFALLAGPIGILIAIFASLAWAISNISQIMYILQHDSSLVILGIKAYWQEFVTFLKTKILDPITNFFKDVWEGIKIMAREAVDAVMGYFKPLLNAIDKISSGVSSAYKTVKGGVSSAYNAVSNFITGKAGGGTVMGNNAYVVGENGPEIFTPSISGNISPNGSFGGGNITININGGTYLSETVAKDMGDMIIQQFMRQARI